MMKEALFLVYLVFHWQSSFKLVATYVKSVRVVLMN